MTGTATIYHNPACSHSRSTLALIRAAAIEPRIIEYLKTPPDHATLRELLWKMHMPARALLRQKERQFAELGLADATLTEDELIDQMVGHPILMNRPIVVTARGVRLCRPPALVHEILPVPAAAHSGMA